MAQRILMIALIIVIVIGGGLYAYRELVPPLLRRLKGPSILQNLLYEET